MYVIFLEAIWALWESLIHLNNCDHLNVCTLCYSTSGVLFILWLGTVLLLLILSPMYSIGHMRQHFCGLITTNINLVSFRSKVLFLFHSKGIGTMQRLQKNKSRWMSLKMCLPSSYYVVGKVSNILLSRIMTWFKL